MGLELRKKGQSPVANFLQLTVKILTKQRKKSSNI